MTEAQSVQAIQQSLRTLGMTTQVGPADGVRDAQFDAAVSEALTVLHEALTGKVGERINVYTPEVGAQLRAEIEAFKATPKYANLLLLDNNEFEKLGLDAGRAQAARGMVGMAGLMMSKDALLYSLVDGFGSPEQQRDFKYIYWNSPTDNKEKPLYIQKHMHSVIEVLKNPNGLFSNLDKVYPAAAPAPVVLAAAAPSAAVAAKPPENSPATVPASPVAAFNGAASGNAPVLDIAPDSIDPDLVSTLIGVPQDEPVVPVAPAPPVQSRVAVTPVDTAPAPATPAPVPATPEPVVAAEDMPTEDAPMTLDTASKLVEQGLQLLSETINAQAAEMLSSVDEKGNKSGGMVEVSVAAPSIPDGEFDSHESLQSFMWTINHPLAGKFLGMPVNENNLDRPWEYVHARDQEIMAEKFYHLTRKMGEQERKGFELAFGQNGQKFIEALGVLDQNGKLDSTERLAKSPLQLNGFVGFFVTLVADWFPGMIPMLDGYAEKYLGMKISEILPPKPDARPGRSQDQDESGTALAGAAPPRPQAQPTETPRVPAAAPTTTGSTGAGNTVRLTNAFGTVTTPQTESVTGGAGQDNPRLAAFRENGVDALAERHEPPSPATPEPRPALTLAGATP